MLLYTNLIAMKKQLDKPEKLQMSFIYFTTPSTEEVGIGAFDLGDESAQGTPSRDFIDKGNNDVPAKLTDLSKSNLIRNVDLLSTLPRSVFCYPT